MLLVCLIQAASSASTNTAPLNLMADPTVDSNQYKGEMAGALRAQANIYPLMTEQERLLAPQLQQTQLGGYGQYVTGLLGQYGELNQPTQQFQTQYAGQQLGMLGVLGSQATGAAIGSLDATTRGIYSTFGNQALSDLQYGSSLNAQETEQAQQAARAAAQARGLQFSRQGGDLEILNTYNMGQKRLKERQATATTAYQMGANQQAFGAQTYLTPSYNASQPFGLAGMYAGAQAGYANLGQSFLTPESQYLANIRANRIQQENADNAASAQVKAGMWAGLGALAGGIIGKCWVAREVYGSDNAKWVFFRDWLESDAPSWLDELYEQEGERFAEFISDKPILKNIVRKAMDLVVG
jgi:hypothetical protein